MTTPTYDREQADLLRAADNADAAGVRTVNTTGGVRALAGVAEQLRRAGASLPAPEVKGTPESGVTAGLSIALALVEAALASAPPSAPVGVIGDAIQHLSNWLDLNECECESGHQCGRTEVERTRDQLRALAQQPEVADEAWRAGFVAGAKWWEWETIGATMWQSDQQRAYEAAIKSRPNVTPQPAIPEGMDEAINATCAQLEMIGLGRDTVTGDQLSIMDMRRLANDALFVLTKAWNEAAIHTQEPDHG